MTPELRTSCEVVFQEHKTLSAISWKKDAFRGRMSIGLCEMAKETLVQKKIIYFPRPAKKTTTVLNPDVATAGSFEEAVAIMQNKMGEPAPVTRPANFVIYDETDFPQFNIPEITSYTKASADLVQADFDIAPEKWHLRPVFYYVIWPLAAAVVSVLIAFLMSKSVEMAYN